MPPYRLQTLLEIRTKAEDEAKEAFSIAVKAAEKERAQLAKMKDQLERMKVERKTKVQAFLNEMTEKGGGVAGFQKMSRFEQRLKDDEAQLCLEIEKQKEAVILAEKLVEQRRVEMAEAAKEKKAIEKNKENWAKQVRHERMQREELNQEEIGSVLHLQRSRRENKS